MELIGYSAEWDGRIAGLFRSSILSSCCVDYTEGEMLAWISSSYKPSSSDKWKETYTILAVEGDVLLGFGNADGSYIDCLYVSPHFQKKGIGRMILSALEKNSAPPFSVYSSLTALPFFSVCGYRMIKENIVERDGEMLRNYLMEKS